jgi:hypothetical protein
MSGRYGGDAFTRFLSIVYLVLIVISIFLPSGIRDLVYVAALAVILYTVYRMFSRKLAARRDENAKYLQAKQAFKDFFRLRRDMWNQRREFKFFKCPSCGAALRVPRGKGKIRIVCKRCGTGFERKT